MAPNVALLFRVIGAAMFGAEVPDSFGAVFASLMSLEAVKRLASGGTADRAGESMIVS